MTRATQRAYLVAEKATLENLLSTLREDSVVERMGLESRLHDVTGELATLDARAEGDRAVPKTDLARHEAEFLLYQTEDGQTRVEVRFDGETAWLSLGQMAELFQRDKSVISRHIKNVFEEGELDRASVVAESATTAANGKTYQVDYFNLDVIISVGYRVKSHRGTQFRIWATQRLREYIIKASRSMTSA
jgi:hypothetical protein